MLKNPKNQNSWCQPFVTNLMKVKCNMTWWLTGTPEYLNFYDGVYGLFDILNYSRSITNISNLDSIKEVFIKNCIRQNVHINDLPHFLGR